MLCAIKGQKAPPPNFEFTQQVKMVDDEENNSEHLVFVIIIKTELNVTRSSQKIS